MYPRRVAFSSRKAPKLTICFVLPLFPNPQMESYVQRDELAAAGRALGFVEG
jgi:hypothetical protein